VNNVNDRNSTIELITSYINALISGDFKTVQFAPDVTLLTPFMEAPVKGKDAVVGALKEISNGVEGIKVLRFVIDDEFACALLEFKAKNGIVVNMCDAYRIYDGKLAEIRPYFDPRPLMGGG
jgi:hypothetical protein